MDHLPQGDVDFKKSDKDWQETLKKYPSLKKFDEQGDDYIESHDGREEKLRDFIKSHKHYEQMKDNPTRIVDAMDEFAAQHDFLINIGSDKGRTVTNLILENKPKVLVELGGYVGYSAILFGNQLKKQSTPEQPGHIWSLEFEERFATIARDLISLAGLTDTVTVVTGSADDSLRRLKQEGKIDHIDFLFLDHVEDLYVQDLKVAMNELLLLKSGSRIVADNVLRPGAPEYRKYVRGHHGLRSRAVKGLIIPGDYEDELEITNVL